MAIPIISCSKAIIAWYAAIPKWLKNPETPEEAQRSARARMMSAGPLGMLGGMLTESIMGSSEPKAQPQQSYDGKTGAGVPFANTGQAPSKQNLSFMKNISPEHHEKIKEFSENHDYIIHFDSDIIFRKECISLLKEKINEGYDLIGPRRCYKNNMNGRTDLSELQDVSQTYFYAFNKTKISEQDFEKLKLMIVGYYNPLSHPILDYFDPVSFDILNNGGKSYFLDVDQVGGLTEDGNRKNKFEELNSDMDFGECLMHFAGIGSGRKFYTKGAKSAHASYVDWAIKRYGLYHKLFFEEELEGVEVDQKAYEQIKSTL
jgi:hypothetical protein